MNRTETYLFEGAASPNRLVEHTRFDDTASVCLLLAENDERLPSQVSFERDKLGRITEETQRLCDTERALQGMQMPPLEHEHRIAHQLDELGNRARSQLQDIGTLDWLRYGSR